MTQSIDNFHKAKTKFTFGISPRSWLASQYLFLTSSNWSAKPRLKAWNCRLVYCPPEEEKPNIFLKCHGLMVDEHYQNKTYIIICQLREYVVWVYKNRKSYYAIAFLFCNFTQEVMGFKREREQINIVVCQVNNYCEKKWFCELPAGWTYLYIVWPQRSNL